MQTNKKFLIAGIILFVIAVSLLIFFKKFSTSDTQVVQITENSQTLLLSDADQIAPRVGASQKDAKSLELAPTVTISANPATVEYSGTPAVVSWSSSKATSCVDGHGNSMRLNGSISIAPKENYTLDILCKNAEGERLESVTVSVTKSPTISLFIYPETVTLGEKSTISWITTNATKCVDGSGKTLRLSDAFSLFPTKQYNFNISCTGADGEVKKSAKIAVVAPVVKPKVPTPVVVPADPVVVNPTCTIRASRTTASPGEQFSIIWTTNNVTNPVMYKKAGSGSAVAVADDGYIMWVAGSNRSTTIERDVFEIGGGGVNAPYKPICSVSVNITPNPVVPPPVLPASTPAPTVSISASPSVVAAGGSATILWSTTNASTCIASGRWHGVVAVSGSGSTGVLNSPGVHSYALSCMGMGGSISSQATVFVSAPPINTSAPTITFSASPMTVVQGGSTTLTWSSTNATSCSSNWGTTVGTSGVEVRNLPYMEANFMLTCTGAGGSVSKTVSILMTATTTVTPAPTVTFTTDKATAVPGVPPNNVTPDFVTLSWTSSGATSCVQSGWDSTFNGQFSGLLTVGPPLTIHTSGSVRMLSLSQQNLIYGITCSGPGGSTSRDVSVNWTTPCTGTISCNIAHGSSTIPTTITDWIIPTGVSYVSISMKGANGSGMNGGAGSFLKYNDVLIEVSGGGGGMGVSDAGSGTVGAGGLNGAAGAGGVGFGSGAKGTAGKGGPGGTTSCGTPAGGAGGATPNAGGNGGAAGFWTSAGKGGLGGGASLEDYTGGAAGAGGGGGGGGYGGGGGGSGSWCSYNYAGGGGGGGGYRNTSAITSDTTGGADIIAVTPGGIIRAAAGKTAGYVKLVW